MKLPKAYFISLICPALASAQLLVSVSPPQVTGDKAIVPLELKNQFNQGVASARAAVLLLDEQGKLVGQSAKWVIGSLQTATNPKPGLAAGSTNTFNFVITAKVVSRPTPRFAPAQFRPERFQIFIRQGHR